MIVTYGLSSLNEYFNDLEDVVLVIYTNEITDELILSVDELLLSNHINFKSFTGEKILFSVSIPVWEKFTENVTSLIFSGELVENQFTYNHLKCMKRLENLFIKEINYPFLNKEEIKNLLHLKRVIMNNNKLIWIKYIIYLHPKLREII
jgi:hypothetical protein